MRSHLHPTVPLLACLSAVTLLAGCGAGDERPISVPGPAQSANQFNSSSTQSAGPGFTLVATGDVLIHPALTEQATGDGGGKRDYRQLMAGVKPVISAADLAICHLEVPLAGPGGPFRGYPDFNAPPEVADALADTGYDDCSTASNHTLDMGVDGVTRTLDRLDEVGIKHTGSARSAQEARTPLVLDVKGVKVGHVSHTFGFNGRKLPADKPWLSNTLSADEVIGAARATRAAGAEVVVASLHWGTEYVHEPTADQRRIAQKLLADPNVDLIIGHHAHVVQPMEKINGKWVAYGLGNHVARHAEPRGTTEEGLVGRFRFVRSGDRWTVDKAEYVPTLVDLGPPIRLRDLSTPDGMDAARVSQVLKRIDQVVLSRGAAEQGLTRPGR